MSPLEVPVEIGREEAARRAQEELAKAKYGGVPPWLEDLLARVDRLLERLVEFLLGLDRDQPGAGVSPGFVVAATVLLAALAVVVWRVGVPKWRARTRDAAVGSDRAQAPQDYRSRAAAHAAAGRWSLAVQDQFRAVVRALEEAGVLDPRPARTAWEAASSAGRALPGCRDDLSFAAEVFNAVTYGDAAADAAVYDRLLSIDAAVTQAAATVDLAAEPAPAGR